MAAASLTDQMGAMSLVDDLRHRQMVVQEHLDLPRRRAEVAKRIREYYQSQNIVVDEALVEEGVRAYFDKRLTFEAPRHGKLAERLAALYISRQRWTRPLVLAVLALGVVGGGNYVMQRSQEATMAAEAARVAGLSKELRVAAARFSSMGLNQEEKTRIASLSAAGESAIKGQDAKAAQDAITRLDELYAFAETPLALTIVDRVGAKSGVERRYKASGGKSTFLVVEALDPSGKAVPIQITSAETGETRQATLFAVRVPPAEYDKARQDKLDDGHIDQRVIGEKPAESLTFRYGRGIADKPDFILEW